MNNLKFWKLNKGRLVLIIMLAILIIFGIGKTVFAADNFVAEGYNMQLYAETGADTAKTTGVFANILGYIASKILTLVAALINFSLNIGNGVIKLPIVQMGSKIVLNFANLGFVLAIIVIAFATIFRVQSYAMKQTLWKLIVAALLVNFSLVIAGAFISVSNIFTNFFLSRVNNTADLATGLAGVLNPQDLAKVPGAADASIMGTLSSIWQGFGGILQYVASLFFVVAFTFIILLTFFAIFIMLLIRAIVLAVLLIFMPLVWLAWIFPATAEHWKKWWSEFLRWNFFAPAMLFFIYLVIATGKSLEAIRAANMNSQQIAQAFGTNLTLSTDFFEYAASCIITAGLLIGGLYVANKLGITFAGTAYGWAQSAGKGFGIWAGRKTLEQTGGRILGSKLFKGDVEKGKKGLVERLSASKIPGVRYIGQGINRLGAQTEKFVQGDYEKLAKELTPEKLNNEILASRGAKRAVLFKEAAKRKDIDMKKLAAVINNPKEMERIAGEFNRSGLNFKDLEKTIGRSLEMITAKTTEELKNATDKFVQSLTPKDYAKGQWNDVFKKTEDKTVQGFQTQLASAFAEYDPGAYAKIAPNVKGENLADFASIMDDKIQSFNLHPDPKMREKGKKAEDALKKTLNRRALFGEEAGLPPTPTT